jgi:hypothetical protein
MTRATTTPIIAPEPDFLAGSTGLPEVGLIPGGGGGVLAAIGGGGGGVLGAAAGAWEAPDGAAVPHLGQNFSSSPYELWQAELEQVVTSTSYVNIIKTITFFHFAIFLCKYAESAQKVSLFTWFRPLWLLSLSHELSNL